MDLLEQLTFPGYGPVGGLGVSCWKRHEGMQQVQVSGSGLLAAPLVGHRPAKQLLHMTSHIHRVIQVKVPIWIQHAVTTETETKTGN